MIKKCIVRPDDFAELIRSRYDVARDYYNVNYPEYQCHGDVSFLQQGIELHDFYQGSMPYYRMQITSKDVPISFFSNQKVLLEMNLQFQSMPIYHQRYHTAKAAYGFSVLISDTTMDGSRFGKSAMLCILNTESGIVIYPNRKTDDLPVSPLSLGKKLGDRFTIGFLIENNSVEIIVDNHSLGRFNDVNVSRSLSFYNRVKSAFQSVGTYGRNAISFVWQRTGDFIDSPENSFSVRIENMIVSAFQNNVSEATDIFSGNNKAKNYQDRVFVKTSDYDPLTGAGERSDGFFYADRTFNSVIYDRGYVSDINRAELISKNFSNRVSRNFVALYYSNDNKKYTPIPFFSLFRQGNRVLFYNFFVRARYLKIHFTYNELANPELAIANSLQDLIKAYHSEQPLLCGDLPFAHQTKIKVSNESNETVYDKIVRYRIEDLGISAENLTSEMRDVRFRYKNLELPHYLRDHCFYVRIFEIPAHSSISIDILYGNPSAESVSDGVGTLEIEYGNKTETRIPGGRWITSVELMPDGSLITIGHYAGQEQLCIVRSTDGGRTWSEPTPICYTEGTRYSTETDKIHDSGGFIVDKEKNIVYFFCFHNVVRGKERSIVLLTSKDSGYTWSLRTLDLPKGKFYCSYSNGIKLSTYDGKGENIDYVFTLSVKSDNEEYCFGSSAIYSKDDGDTWLLSESRINHLGGHFRPFLEKGVSEDTVFEKPDGTLIMYCRYQIEGILHFAVARSFDHGITWEETPSKSNVYASNTQPILFHHNAVPMLLWGGNNAMGTFSYCRFPLNIAYSNDNGETFIGIQDISFQLRMANRESVRRLTAHEITNPDIAIFEHDDLKYAYIISMQDRILIEDFDNYVYRTKGAFDSFESRIPELEGWVTISGERPRVIDSDRKNVKNTLCLGSETKLSRSIPYSRKGTAIFDLYVDSIFDGAHIELQSAYHRDPVKAAPISLQIDCQGYIYYNAHGEWMDTGLFLEHGTNTISIVFDGTSSSALLILNGTEKEIVFDSSVGDYICFAYLYNGKRSIVCLDCFALIAEDCTQLK